MVGTPSGPLLPLRLPAHTNPSSNQFPTTNQGGWNLFTGAAWDTAVSDPAGNDALDLSAYTSSGTCAKVQSAEYPVTPGVWYTFSFYVRTDDVRNNLLLTFQWFNGTTHTNVSVTRVCGSAAYQWQQVSYCAQAPAGMVSVRLQIDRETGESNGSISSIKITNGGSGYTSAPTVTLTAVNLGSGATATALVSGGVVTVVNLTANGSAYDQGATVAFSGGGGTGAAAIAMMPWGRMWVGKPTFKQADASHFSDYDLAPLPGRAFVGQYCMQDYLGNLYVKDATQASGWKYVFPVTIAQDTRRANYSIYKDRFNSLYFGLLDGHAGNWSKAAAQGMYTYTECGRYFTGGDRAGWITNKDHPTFNLEADLNDATLYSDANRKWNIGYFVDEENFALKDLILAQRIYDHVHRYDPGVPFYVIGSQAALVGAYMDANDGWIGWADHGRLDSVLWNPHRNGPVVNYKMQSGTNHLSAVDARHDVYAGIICGARGVLYYADPIDTTSQQVWYVTVTNGGSGYASGATVSFTPVHNGSGATATATVVGGVVTGITVTGNGSGYDQGATVTITPVAGGSGATATAQTGQDYTLTAHFTEMLSLYNEMQAIQPLLQAPHWPVSGWSVSCSNLDLMIGTRELPDGTPALILMNQNASGNGTQTFTLTFSGFATGHEPLHMLSAFDYSNVADVTSHSFQITLAPVGAGAGTAVLLGQQVIPVTTVLTGAPSGGQPSLFDKAVTTGRQVSLAANYSFTAADTNPPWVDLRGATEIRILIDSSAAGAFNLDIESSGDGTTAAGAEYSGLTTNAPKELAGPFGYLRPKLNSLASGTLKVYIYALYG